jgi:hypothetical protein
VSAKAAEDAAKGLKNTDAQVELGRQVDRMYGSYQKFGPGLRNAISTYTPFVSWTINAVNFLYHVLPADHPVLTSLVASASVATRTTARSTACSWTSSGRRRPAAAVAAGVDSRQGRLPPSRLALHAVRAAGQRRRNPNRRLESLLLPQLSEITKNLSGQDWTGKKDLSEHGESGARDVLAAVASFVEGRSRWRRRHPRSPA